jgi:hypothetical protein
VCTVLLRVRPGDPIPLLLGAVRDEFVERPWDPPGRHWDGPFARLLGGRDRVAGGTWLAVDPERFRVAALLNAGRRDEPIDGRPRPTRGTLALHILTSAAPPDDLDRYDRFHLLRAGLDGAELWSWDGASLRHVEITPGDHVIVNDGLDAPSDPLVPHFGPLLAALPSTPETWRDLLAGDGLDPSDERALVVAKEIDGRRYGSTSASLVTLAPGLVRYEFTATPLEPDWWIVATGEPPDIRDRAELPS